MILGFSRAKQGLCHRKHGGAGVSFCEHCSPYFYFNLYLDNYSLLDILYEFKRKSMGHFQKKLYLRKHAVNIFINWFHHALKWAIQLIKHFF